MLKHTAHAPVTSSSSSLTMFTFSGVLLFLCMFNINQWKASTTVVEILEDSAFYATSFNAINNTFCDFSKNEKKFPFNLFVEIDSAELNFKTENNKTTIGFANNQTFTGICNENVQLKEQSFTMNLNHTIILEFVFIANEKLKYYQLENITLKGVKESIKPDLRLTTNDDEQFDIDKIQGYRCKDLELNYEFHSYDNRTVSAAIKLNLRFGAFVNANKNVTFLECRGQPTGAALPIIIGTVLLGLLVVSLIVYVILRNRYN